MDLRVSPCYKEICTSHEVYVPRNVNDRPGSHPRHFYYVEDGIIQEIEVSVFESKTYSIDKILSTYGQPSEVWIHSYSGARERDELPFFIIILYPQKGIMAMWAVNGEEQGDQIVGCPNDYPYPVMWLWEPGEELSFLEAASIIAGIHPLDLPSFLPVDQVSEMDVEEFFETFQVEGNNFCLETPAEVWRFS